MKPHLMRGQPFARHFYLDEPGSSQAGAAIYADDQHIGTAVAHPTQIEAAIPERGQMIADGTMI